MTLFPDRPDRPRIAVFARFAFPIAEEAALYRQLDELAKGLGAEFQVFHSVLPDPRPLAADLRARLGTGLFVPQHHGMHGNDVEHFRHTLPARCASLVSTLAAFSHASGAEVCARPEVLEAFGFARWVQAWGADLVVSHGLAEGSLQALVAAHLLDLPRCVVLTEPAIVFEYGVMLPLHVEQACVVVATDARVHDDLLARFGESVLDKMVVASDLTALAVRAALGRALASPRVANAPVLGPTAAFVTRPRATARTLTAASPFLVLGAERTGSNMLVDVLAVQPGIACANEVFNPRLIADGYMPWLSSSRVSEDELRRLRRDDPAALHTRLLLDGAETGASWAGFKLLYSHGVVDDRIVDALVAERELVVVHLLRADRLRRWLSLSRARASDAWFEVGQRVSPTRDEPIVLDA